MQKKKKKKGYKDDLRTEHSKIHEVDNTFWFQQMMKSYDKCLNPD